MINANIMEQNVLTKNIWNAAGKAGLALGAVSTAYLFAGQWLAGNLEPATLWQQVVALILWAAKFGGCIWLMKFFMVKFAYENSVTNKSIVFRMGMTIALLSAVVYSAIYLANMLYISADYYDQIFQTVVEQVKPALDSNSLTALEKVIGNLPQIMFVYNLIYCFLFGTVLSAILSRNIPSSLPQADNKTEEQ